MSELVALHDDMIKQIRLDGLRKMGHPDFLTSLIEQHQKAAASLRSQLEVVATEPAVPAAPFTKPVPKRRGRWFRRLPSALKRYLTAKT